MRRRCAKRSRGHCSAWAKTSATTSAKFTAIQGEKLDGVTGQISALTEGNERRQETLRANVEAKLVELKTDAATSTRAPREEVTQNLQTLGGTLTQSVEQISQAQEERLDRVSVGITELTQGSREQQEALRTTVEQRLDAIRAENTEKLENIRQTVDEKLQSTLNERRCPGSKRRSARTSCSACAASPR